MATIDVRDVYDAYRSVLPVTRSEETFESGLMDIDLFLPEDYDRTCTVQPFDELAGIPGLRYESTDDVKKFFRNLIDNYRIYALNDRELERLRYRCNACDSIRYGDFKTTCSTCRKTVCNKCIRAFRRHKGAVLTLKCDGDSTHDFEHTILDWYCEKCDRRKSRYVIDAGGYGDMLCSDCFGEHGNVFDFRHPEQAVAMPVNAGLGSLFDWIPFASSQWTYALVNVNRASPMHGDIAIATYDDHGRSGFYHIGTRSCFQEILTKTNAVEERLFYDGYFNNVIKYYTDFAVCLG